MCVKLPPEDMNPGPSSPQHPTNTHICRVIIAPKVCNGNNIDIPKMHY